MRTSSRGMYMSRPFPTLKFKVANFNINIVWSRSLHILATLAKFCVPGTSLLRTVKHRTCVFRWNLAGRNQHALIFAMFRQNMGALLYSTNVAQHLGIILPPKTSLRLSTFISAMAGTYSPASLRGLNSSSFLKLVLPPLCNHLPSQWTLKNTRWSTERQALGFELKFVSAGLEDWVWEYLELEVISDESL